MTRARTTTVRHRKRAADPQWETAVRGLYRLRFLPPFRRFRGIEIPWNNRAELEQETERVVKSSRSRKVVKLSAGHFGSPVELYVKRYNFKTWYGPLLRSPRRTRAREEFELGRQLFLRDVRTPRPVWLAEARGALSPYCMLATEALPEAETIVERWCLVSTKEEREEIITALGRFAYNIHSVGFYHDDFKAEHVLLFPDAPADPHEFYLIDLLGGRFSSRLSKLSRAKNLYQLLRSFLPKRKNFGFTEAYFMKLLEAYAGTPKKVDEWAKRVEKIGTLKGRKLRPPRNK